MGPEIVDPGGAHALQYTLELKARDEEVFLMSRVASHSPRTEPDSLISSLAFVSRYNLYFLNRSHHARGEAPALWSNHFGVGPAPARGGSYETFFNWTDCWVQNVAEPLLAAGRSIAPGTEYVMNEARQIRAPTTAHTVRSHYPVAPPCSS